MPSALSKAVKSEIGQTWLIGGRVQGVGFRPFVCVMANELGVRGSVRNRGGQVEVIAIGEQASVELLLLRLLAEHPPIARPELIAIQPCAATADCGFRILPSGCGNPGGAVLPDESTCEACLTEMADPNARRYRYPFIACTQCGPRYTTMASPPFDRATTGMAGFPLCRLCRAEYEKPEDRRFHAQLIACAACGPSLSFRDGSEHIRGNEPALARAIETLRTGGIVAMRGIGGYHLLCDATHHAAISRLRDRKRRPTKPLAVMFPRAGHDGLDHLRLHCGARLQIPGRGACWRGRKVAAAGRPASVRSTPGRRQVDHRHRCRDGREGQDGDGRRLGHRQGDRPKAGNGLQHSQRQHSRRWEAEGDAGAGRVDRDGGRLRPGLPRAQVPHHRCSTKTRAHRRHDRRRGE